MTEERLNKAETYRSVTAPLAEKLIKELATEIRRCWAEIEELNARLARMRAAGAAIAELQGQEAEV